MKLKNKEQIEAWLEASDLEAVVEALKEQLKSSKIGKPLYADALVLSAQLKKINADKIDRVMSYEQESLSLNNFRRSLVEFIEMVEKYEGEEQEHPPVSTTIKVEKAAERKGIPAWVWLLIPLAAFGIWWFFLRNDAPISSGPEANIMICNLSKMSNQGHCCLEDLQRISLFQDGATLYVTATLPNYSNNDPVIKGVVFWSTGETFPTGPINLKLDTTIGDLCYVSMIQPLHGIRWTPGKYKLQIQVDGRVVGEKGFEIMP
jgi:hypothetical protein